MEVENASVSYRERKANFEEERREQVPCGRTPAIKV